KSWQQYAAHSETKSIQPLIDLYAAVYRKDAADYLPQLEQHLDVDHYLKYLAHGMINCQENPSTHNLRWIRDPAIGRFQILPWYQAPPHFILTGYHELWKRKGWDFHPPMTAINDIADGLLRRPELRQRCLTHLWRLLQTTHHPDRIRQRIDELQERFRPDAYADNHMHYGGEMERYISSAEWEETVDRIRLLTADRIAYLERVIRGGPLQTETYKNTLTLSTTNYADSVLAEITFQVTEPPEKLNLLQIGNRSYAPAAVTGDRATYRPRHRISAAASRTPVPLGPGIIIEDLDRVLNEDLDFIGSSSQLAAHYRPHKASVTMLMPGPLVSLSLSNAITSQPLALDDAIGQPRTPEQTLNPIRPDGIVLSDRPVQLRSIVVRSNRTITSNWHIAHDEHLILKPNITLRFAPDASLIVRGQMTAIGTKESPIVFTASDQTWGGVFLNSLSARTNRFQHCLFEKSSNTVINGMPVTASLAAYTAPVTVSNCVFRHTAADDAFNSKYVSPSIANCTFSNNLDAIDIDMGGGIVTGSRFTNNRDDCIDLSSSWARIEDNFIQSFGDKGISVGEKSKPTIVNNHISDATMGVAVKDLSHAILENNTFTNNRKGIALYEKKPSFGPASARVDGAILTNQLVNVPK
ncbi:MAG: right-handed parallel beta-helix repeat-containing protein, partial [Limisphaerales bacterium]